METIKLTVRQDDVYEEVAKAMEEWMSLTNPEKMMSWRVKAEEAESELRICVQSRTANLRRRTHPF